MPASVMLAGEPTPFGAHEQRFSGPSFQLALALAASEVEGAAGIDGVAAVVMLLVRLDGELFERLACRGPPGRYRGTVGESLGREP